MGTLNKETGAIELNSRNGKLFRMYGDSSWSKHCYYIVGIYGPHLFVYANCLQDAFDIVADESTEFDGMYVCDSVNEEISRLQDAQGITDEQVWEDPSVMDEIYTQAEENTFTVGNYSQRLQSDEWHAQEVTRADIFSLRGYPSYS